MIIFRTLYLPLLNFIKGIIDFIDGRRVLLLKPSNQQIIEIMGPKSLKELKRLSRASKYPYISVPSTPCMKGDVVKVLSPLGVEASVILDTDLGFAHEVRDEDLSCYLAEINECARNHAEVLHIYMEKALAKIQPSDGSEVFLVTCLWNYDAGKSDGGAYYYDGKSGLCLTMAFKNMHESAKLVGIPDKHVSFAATVLCGIGVIENGRA